MHMLTIVVDSCNIGINNGGVDTWLLASYWSSSVLNYTLSFFLSFFLSFCIPSHHRPQEANKEEFELNSMRCGRKLSKDGDVGPHLFLYSSVIMPEC